MLLVLNASAEVTLLLKTGLSFHVKIAAGNHEADISIFRFIVVGDYTIHQESIRV